MAKTYILSAFDHVFEAKRYFWTLENSLGDSVFPISIMYQPHDEIPQCRSLKLIHAQKPYPGNTGRHKDFHDLLPSLNLEDNSWIVFTDVHDVIFQCPFPEFPENADILVCPEGKTFGEIEYWRERYPERVWGWEAYNVGTFAMRLPIFKEYLDFLYQEWMRFFDWYKGKQDIKTSPIKSFPFEAPMLQKTIRDSIAKVFNAYSDTLVFNTFLRETNYRQVEVPALFTCYAFQYELGNICIKDGKTYTKDGKLVSVVHYNGATKKYIHKDLQKKE